MAEILVRITNGEIQNKTTVRRAFSDLKDGRYRIKIDRANQRSAAQNAFYWLLLTDYIQPGLYNLGYREIKTKDDAHVFCCNEFLKKQLVNELTGEVKEIVRSTTELTTTEWEAYREDLNQFAAEYLGVTLPEPNQQFSCFLATPISNTNAILISTP